MKTLLLATRNPGKVVEIRERAAAAGYAVSSLLDLDLELSVVEDADSFAGNAVKKARAVAEVADCAALADDSGLEVDALGGLPGVRSARYGGEGLTDQARCEKLLDALRAVPEGRRSARFRAVLAYVEPGGDPVTFEGVLEGRIARAAAGSHGFGYDPVFIPEQHRATLAELGPGIKNRISHRARALEAFFAWSAGRGTT